ncbi:hypothetical protein [Tamlana flava]|uniref:hypothetical protein n=1 Tax=Tamlana flava TaxID=3158572 RepID=UPI00351ADC10
MKSIKNKLREIALLLAALIFFQCCSVYRTVTLEEAIKGNAKVKVKTFDNQSYKYKRIEIVDNKIYGIQPKKNEKIITAENKRYSVTNWEEVKIEIEEKSIEKIKLKDKNVSNFLTGVLITGIGVFIYKFRNFNAPFSS